MAKKIEEYSTEKLKKEIKFSGWIVSIFAIAIAFFSIRIVYDLIQGNDPPVTFAIVGLAAGSAAGSGAMFLQRKKLINELKNRNNKS